LISLLALAGCREKVEYHRIEFPGFSLEAPTALTYGKDHLTEYRAGQAQAIFGTRLVVVGWQPGEHATTAEMPMLVRAMTAALPDSAKLETDPAQATTVSGHDATRVDAEIETMKLSILDIECGKRSVMLGLGATDNLDEMRDRILASFDCHPVAAQDQANDDLVVAVMQIPQTGSLDSTSLDKILPAIFGSVGADWTSERSETRMVDNSARAFQVGRMKAEGETMAGVLTVWNCAGRADAVMALALAQVADGSPTSAIDFLTKLRCAKPADPPLPLAPAPPAEAPAPK
jgi:hypothetical protein